MANAREVVRRHVEFLDLDRPLHPDHTTMQQVVKSCEILEEVESEVGSLDFDIKRPVGTGLVG